MSSTKMIEVLGDSRGNIMATVKVDTE